MLSRTLTCALPEMRISREAQVGYKIHFMMKLTQIMSRLLNVTQKKNFQFLMGLPQQEHKLFRVLVGSVWK